MRAERYSAETTLRGGVWSWNNHNTEMVSGNPAKGDYDYV